MLGLFRYVSFVQFRFLFLHAPLPSIESHL